MSTRTRPRPTAHHIVCVQPTIDITAVQVHTHRRHNLDDATSSSIITDRIGQLILAARRYCNISTGLDNLFGEDVFTDVGKVP